MKDSNLIPAPGDLAIITLENGSVQVYTGNINKSNPDLCIIEEFYIDDNNKYIHVKCRKMRCMVIDTKVTEHEGRQIFDNQSFDYKAIVKVVMNPDKAIQVYRKRTWLMKLFGKPEIKFNYIMLKDASLYGESERHLILKDEFWTPKEYKSSSYSLLKI